MIPFYYASIRKWGVRSDDGTPDWGWYNTHAEAIAAIEQFGQMLFEGTLPR